MIVIGLDPGTEISSVVGFDGQVVGNAFTKPNAELLGLIQKGLLPEALLPHLVIEQVESMGMPVGREVFETVFWSGRFAQAHAGIWSRVTRRDVKQHLCFSARATDANIRQALIDRFGPGKEKAIGTKKAQGPLYGLKGHEFAALAVAVTYYDRQSPNSVRSIADGIGF